MSFQVLDKSFSFLFQRMRLVSIADTPLLQMLTTGPNHDTNCNPNHTNPNPKPYFFHFHTDCLVGV